MEGVEGPTTTAPAVELRRRKLRRAIKRREMSNWWDLEEISTSDEGEEEDLSLGVVAMQIGDRKPAAPPKSPQGINIH
ncbi:UNVERIFIED_CONTAM: hypothetical protein Sangu_2836500 [Sesamum angustifolium]|uniref:Uncharacterized protein n=1 Tax=Sesamum angustifolium TaxID=2727405 RepID=A0AAW2IQ98_9LAMI